MSGPGEVLRRLSASLATRIVALLVAATLLTGGLVGLLVSARSQAALREPLLQADLATADLAAAHIHGYVTDAQASIRELAARRLVRDAARRGDLNSVTPDIEGWFAYQSRLDGASLYDTDGVNRATSLADKNIVNQLDVSDRAWFQQALETGQPYMDEALVSRATGHPVIPYGVPILDEQGNVRAVLVASVSLAELANTLVDLGAGPEARASLIDLRQGIILAHRDPRRVLQPVSGQNEATRRLQAGERGVIETLNSAGELTLSAYAPVAGMPWGVLVQKPSAEAFAPLRVARRESMLLAAPLVALAGALGGALALGIVGPLGRLTRAAEALSRGSLASRSEIRRRDEIGRLSLTFDSMAAQLQATVLRREALLRVARRFAAEADGERLLGELLREAVAVADGDVGTVRRWDEAQQGLVCGHSTLQTTWRLPVLALGEGVAGRVAEQRTPLVVNDYPSEFGDTPQARAGTRAVVGVPLLHEGRLLGVLLVASTTPGKHFGAAEVEMLELLAGIAASMLATIELAARLQDLARTDALTGVANRRAAAEHLGRFLALAGRHAQPVALAMVDLDFFKRVNDTHGHGMGDEVLRSFAALLRQAFREEDVVARWGGEEFVVGLYGSTAAHCKEPLKQFRRNSGWRSLRWAMLRLTAASVSAPAWPNTRWTAPMPMRCATWPTLLCTRQNTPAERGSGLRSGAQRHPA